MIRTTITVSATHLLLLCASSRGMRSFPLAGHAGLEQNIVVGSIAVLLALLGNMLEKYVWPLFSLQVHLSTVECRVPIVSPSQKMTL